MNKIFSKIKSIKPEFFYVILLLAIAAGAHGINFLHFPYFENDEATYVSQAWSFIHSLKLSPYTYYYDHAPAGWMFLGLWYFITGGLTTFGRNPIISGRIFIFILHMFSVLFLYIVTKRVTRQTLAASLAVIIFSLSPLEIYFGRRILLDNIMVFWVLFSLFFATKTPQKLGTVVLSAFTFAIAALTKENALFLGPAILYIIWIYSQKKIQVWSIGLWAIVAGVLVAIYPLYAFLKGELFQTGTLFGGTNAHVSLIQTALEQGARGNFAFPWEHRSDFYLNLVEWLSRDPFTIVLGAICLLACMILNEKYREIKAIALTAVAEILFLLRGKLVIDFYILSVLPLLAITIGIMLSRPMIWAKNHISPRGYSITLASIVILVFIVLGTPAFSRDETSNQQKAIEWIEKNVPKNAYIAIDNYAYPQLHDVDGYNNSDFVFKIQYDSEIQKEKYKSDPNIIQYQLITHEEIVQMRSKNISFIQPPYNRSMLVADFRDNTTSFIDLTKLISTNGDWAQVYKTEPVNAGILADTWRSYKHNFIKETGQVTDTPNGSTTSEGQSYAMLRAVAMNDRVEFDRVWNWTQKNLQKRKDKLFAWKIQIDNQGLNHLADMNSATDADQDIATSLYNAYKLWGDKKYLNSSKEIVSDIWKKEVVSLNGQLYLVSGPDNSFYQQILVNPSYIAPSEYRIFAQIDPSHNWTKLIDDSYTLLAKIQKNSKAGLIPNWVAIESNGDLSSANHLGVSSSDVFGYDAFRISYRLASDIADVRAQDILNKFNDFYQAEWDKNHLIASEYDLDGHALSYYSDVPTSVGAVISLHALNQPIANEVYKNEVANTFHIDGKYWNNSLNYYTQNWAWFGVKYLGVVVPSLKENKLFVKNTKSK